MQGSILTTLFSGHQPLCINSKSVLLLSVTSCHSRTPVHATILLATPCCCPIGFALPGAPDTPDCKENRTGGYMKLGNISVVKIVKRFTSTLYLQRDELINELGKKKQHCTHNDFLGKKGTSSGFDLIVVLTFKIHFDIRLHTVCQSANSALGRQWYGITD